MTRCQLEKCLHMINMSCGEISPHEKCGDKSVLSQLMLFCYEIYFAAIYAVSRNLFCCNLRAVEWRKIKLKIVSVEKKVQISWTRATILSHFVCAMHIFRGKGKAA